MPTIHSLKRAAGAGIAALLALYAGFEASDLGNDAYQWTKDWATYDFRQHLGMSKRFLWQYIHLILQCGLIFLLPFVLTSDVNRSSWLERAVQAASKYWLPVFLFHFPALYMIAALIDHDPTNPLSLMVLLTLTLALCVVCGWLCFQLAPLIARMGRWIGPASQGDPPRIARCDPFAVSGSFSRALDLLKLLAAACVVLGHVSFDVFTDTPFLVFDGHAPRFTIPLFFVISGYLAAFSLHRSQLSFGPELFKRYWSAMPIVLPMLALTPLMNWAGLSIAPEIYRTIDEYTPSETLSLTGISYYFWMVVLSVTYLLESLWLTLWIDGFPLGGVGAFNNAPFWFLCYLIPYHFMLVALVRLRGWARIGWLGALAVVTGPPILMLAPMYFGGAAVYMAHLGVRNRLERRIGEHVTT